MKLFYTISLFILSGIIFTTQAHAIEYGGIGGRPAYPRPDNPRSESIYVHIINPGQTIQEGVELINNTDQDKLLRLYAADSTPSSDGAFACKQLVETKTGVGKWINLQTQDITVKAQTSKIIDFSITAPANAEVGEHNGCILIQAVEDEQDKVGVSLSFRTGLRVALTIPGEIVRQLEIEGVNIVDKSNGRKAIQPIIKNQGNVSVDATVAVSTQDIFGNEFHKSGGEYPILRDEATELNFEQPQSFLGGPYRARVLVAYASEVEELGKEKSDKDIKLFTSTNWFLLPPSHTGLAIEIGLLILSIIFVAWLMYQKAQDRAIQTVWIKYKVKAGEDIQSVGQKYNINWKKLAKANHLKPPYSIRSGQTILVPPKK